MSALMVAWPLKRSVLARLAGIAAGTTAPPAGAELIATGDSAFSTVQVSNFLPAEPDRMCVYGGPVRATRTALTAEVNTPVGPTVAIAPGGAVLESVVLELRCRVFTPGEDIDTVDQLLGRLAQAVATAVVDGPAFFAQGAMSLTAYVQDLTAVAPNPEPSVTGMVSLAFTADVVTT